MGRELLRRDAAMRCALVIASALSLSAR